MLVWLKESLKSLDWCVVLALVLAAAVFVSVFAMISGGRYTIGDECYVSSVDNQNHFSVRWMGFSPSYSNKYPEYHICINNLKSDILAMSIALQIKNQEDSGYYFKIEKHTEPPAGWTIPSMTIGYVDKDETKTFTYSVSRIKPTTIPEGLITENISLVVKAYYDPSLTDLYSQDSFNVTFNFIDRLASVWTTIYHDNFDDGTTQGWSGIGHYPRISVSNTYYRSFKYSLRVNSEYTNHGKEVGFSKTFTIGSGVQKAYLIYSIRSDLWGSARIEFDGVSYFQPDVQPQDNVWYQFTIPLPVSEVPGMSKTTTVGIWALLADYGNSFAYLDDVYVIVM